MERRLSTNRRSVLWQRPRHRTQGETSAYKSLPGSAVAGQQPPTTSQDKQVPIAAVVLRNTYQHNSFSKATTTSTMFSSTGTADQAGTVLPKATVSRNNNSNNNNNDEDDNNSSRSRTSCQLLPPSRRVDHGDDSPVNSPIHQRPRFNVSTTAAAAFSATHSPVSAAKAAAGIAMSRTRVDHVEDSPVNSHVHQRPRLSVATTKTAAAAFPNVFSPVQQTKGAASMAISRLPSRRQLTGAEFDSWTNTSHTSSKNTNIAATFSAAFTAVPAPTTVQVPKSATGSLVSRLPSRRQLLTRAESCNSHSTGVEFDSWLNRSPTSRNTSVNTSFDTSFDTSSTHKSYESAASGYCTSSSIPAAPHLLRLTTQSSARNMMMMMSNSSRSMMSANSSRSLSSSGSGTSSVPKKRRQQRRGRRRDKNDSNSSNGSNCRPTNPMALELREQMSGLTVGTTTTTNNSPARSPSATTTIIAADMATKTPMTAPMDVVDDKRSIVRDHEMNYNSYDSGDSSCQRLLAKCEMTCLVHRKSMSSSGDGGSTSSLPSISTTAASVRSQQHQLQHQHQHNYANHTTNYTAATDLNFSPWQPGSHHFSAFHRRASM